MIRTMRERMGPVIVAIIIGFIAFVFLFYGVFTPGSRVSGATAGTVDGIPISTAEVERMVQNYAQNIQAQKFNPDQLRAFGVYRMVFDQIANQKLMIAEAERLGRVPSDQELQEKISELPYFQKDGKFSFDLYKRVLEANHMTASQFEGSVKDDLIIRDWQEYFRIRAQVTPKEVEDEYQVDGDQRSVRYVLVKTELGRKSIRIADADIQKLLDDPERMKQVQSRFDLGKNGRYKEKKIEEVKKDIARDLVMESKEGDAQKYVDQLADQVADQLKSGHEGDAKVNALIAPLGLKIQTSDWFSRKATSLGDLGDPSEIIPLAFGSPSPIDTKNGGKAKKIMSPMGTIVAVLDGEKSASPAGLTDAEKTKIRARLAAAKQSRFFSDWLGQIKKSAKIVRNENFLGKSGGLFGGSE